MSSNYQFIVAIKLVNKILPTYLPVKCLVYWALASTEALTTFYDMWYSDIMTTQQSRFKVGQTEILKPGDQSIFSVYKCFLSASAMQIFWYLSFIEDYNKGFMASNDGLWKCVNREKGKQ